jgi:Raf kinase inhibitor-like YbhB/YbcL family protein
MSVEFTVVSKSLNREEMIPHQFLYNGFGCEGDNVSPQVEWQGAPEGTKSYALTLIDPDAPTAHGRWHWGVINIPENVHGLDEGASNSHLLPEGAVELITDFHQKGYAGPCLREGQNTHRYVLTVWALREDHLEMSPYVTAEALCKKLEEVSLSKSSFTVKYGH